MQYNRVGSPVPDILIPWQLKRDTHTQKPLYSSSHGRRICRRVPESVPTIGRRGLWSLAIGSGTARGSENSIQRSDLLVGPLQTRRILRYMSPEVPLPYPGHSPRSIRRYFSFRSDPIVLRCVDDCSLRSENDFPRNLGFVDLLTNTSMNK